jgi:hypothetical protein
VKILVKVETATRRWGGQWWDRTVVLYTPRFNLSFRVYTAPSGTFLNASYTPYVRAKEMKGRN